MLAAICFTANTASAAQYGDFYYWDDGTSITISGFDKTAGGPVNIPATIMGKPVVSIAAGAFSYSRWITSVTIPTGVTSIGDTAFSDCTNLSSVTLPTGLISIGQATFDSCSSLATISIPASVTSIGAIAFRGCSNLASITVSSQNHQFSSLSGVLYDGGQSLIIRCPQGKTGAVTIPSGVTRIGDQAFASCSRVSAVTIPSTVTKIGNASFIGCSGLNSVIIPTSVTSIGDYAFSGCDGFADVAIHAGLTTIGMAPFAGCDGVESITVDPLNPAYSTVDGMLLDKSQTILLEAPAGKSGAVAIPSGVVNIAEYAFAGCVKLTGLTIPDSVTSIPMDAFSYCTGLITITIPESVTSIPDRAFMHCESLASVTIPKNVTEVGSSAFYCCYSLTSVTLPSGLTRIGNNVFGKCGLNEIVFPAGLTSIGDDAFSQCDSLTSVAIPEGVASIGIRAFYYCKSLASVTVPASATSISNIAFSLCQSLPAITVDESNPAYRSLDGVLYDKNLTTLIQCPAGKAGDIVIPASVINIVMNAFSSCGSLTNAYFEGNAPTMGGSSGCNFIVNFHGGSTGFTTPTWMGYTAVNLDAPTPVPPDIKVLDGNGNELANGATVDQFGVVGVGNFATVVLTIANTGTIDLTGLSLTKTGDNAADFQISALGTTVLNGGASLTIQVAFKPKATGNRTASIQIGSDDTDENPFTITLAGTGTAPEISIEQPAGNVLADGGVRDFGTQAAGTSKPLVFTINNTGASGLTGLAASITGTHSSDFTVSSAPASPVATGGSTTFVVVFKPTGAGNRGAVLHIANNDPDESPYDINLTGKGIALPEITIEQPAGSGLVDGVSKKSFGTVKVGKVGKTKNFILKNTGTAKLTGLGLTRTGKHKKDFPISTLSKTSLLPGESTSFQMVFKPTAKGTRTAAIHVLSNDADENPFDISVTGAGAAK